MVVEMIDADFSLAEKLGRHPLTKGCNCIDCIHKRKRILKLLKQIGSLNFKSLARMVSLGN